MAILTAMQIVLTRVTAISIGQWLRISFSFLRTAIAGLLMGSVAAMLVAGAGNLLGVVMTGQAIVLGLTVTAVFDGLVYGLVLWQHPVSIPPAAMAQLPMAVITSMLCNTFILAGAGYIAVSDGTEWPQMLQGFATWYRSIGGVLPNFVSFSNRVIKAAAVYPVNAALLYALGRIVDRLLVSVRGV